MFAEFLNVEEIKMFAEFLLMFEYICLHKKNVATDDSNIVLLQQKFLKHKKHCKYSIVTHIHTCTPYKCVQVIQSLNLAEFEF